MSSRFCLARSTFARIRAKRERASRGCLGSALKAIPHHIALPYNFGTMALIVEIAGGILLAVGVVWLLLRIWHPDDDEPGNHPP